MTRLLLVLPLVLLLPLLLADASNYLTTKQGAPKIMQIVRRKNYPFTFYEIEKKNYMFFKVLRSKYAEYFFPLRNKFFFK